jgi:hypothetical protein
MLEAINAVCDWGIQLMSSLSIIVSLLVVAALLGLAGWGLRFFARPSSLFLGGALGITALLVLFDLGVFTSSIEASFFWRKCSLFVEGLMVPIWLFCSLTFGRKTGQWYATGIMVRLMLVASFLLVLFPLLLPLHSFFYSPDFPNEPVLFLTTVGFIYYVVIMAYLVLTLIQFETTFVNASPQALWNSKFHLVGLSLILAVQVFYYSQALLYRTINMEYVQLRSLMFIVAALLMIYSHLRRGADTKITISRQMALKSVVLFSVGAYLVVLGLMGEGLKYCTGVFSRSIGVSLAFLMGLGLLLLLLSNRVRREIKVVLHKHFYQNKYDYRTQWLLLTERLSSPQWDEMLQSVLELYCETFGVSGATLFLYEENRGIYSVAAVHQMDLKNEVFQPDNTLIQFMQQKGWVFFIRDQVSAILEENRRLFEEHQISFVIPFPGTLRIEGFIVLGKMVKPDEAYIYEDFDLMKTCARQAIQAIRQQKLSQALLQTREEAAIGNVATFVMHDLKNQLAALSLVSENAPRLITNPDFQKDLLDSLLCTVHNMQDLIGNLKTLDKQNLLYMEKVDLLTLAKESAVQLGAGHVFVSGKQEFAYVDRGEMQKVVINLLVNGIEASENDKPVQVTVGEQDDLIYMRVSDNGCGMTPQFVQSELFVPFHSTKPAGLGIGLFQCRQIIQSHNGKIDVESTPGVGSTFTVWLPRRQE